MFNTHVTFCYQFCMNKLTLLQVDKKVEKREKKSREELDKLHEGHEHHEGQSTLAAKKPEEQITLDAKKPEDTEITLRKV